MKATPLSTLILCYFVFIQSVAVIASSSGPPATGKLTVVYAIPNCMVSVSFDCDWAMVSAGERNIVLWGMGDAPSNFAEAIQRKSGHREGWASATFVAKPRR